MSYVKSLSPPKDPPSLNWTSLFEPPGEPVPPPVEDIVMEPFVPVVIVTFEPAMRYEVPSVSCVKDPDKP